MNRPPLPGPSGRRNHRRGEGPSLPAVYARYAELIQRQGEALEAEDLDRFQELARSREAVQEEVEELAQRTGTGPPEEWDEEEMQEVYEALREAVHRDRRLRERLQAMKKTASSQRGQVEEREDRLRGYLARDATGTGGASSRVNVRL